MPYLEAGDVLTGNIPAIRLGLGRQTKYLEFVFGKTVIRDVKRGAALGCEMLA